MKVPVLQDWVCELNFMQQSVLITAVRGPDGIEKNHVSKVLLRWYRRCVMVSAFEKKVFFSPYDKGGGSFTGPCTYADINVAVDLYLSEVDRIPHHFQLHFMHAAEIVGYKHPQKDIRDWWHNLYCRIVNDAHLVIESEEVMDRRLGDNETQWREAEEVTAK